MAAPRTQIKPASDFEAQCQVVRHCLGQIRADQAAAALTQLEALQGNETEALWCRLLRLHWQSLSPVQPEMLRQAEDILNASLHCPDPLLRPQALRLKASLLNKCRLFELALRTLGQATAEAQAAGQREQEIQAQNQIARVLYDAEMHAERIAHCEQFLQAYPDAPVDTRVSHYNFMGGAHKWLGRNDLAIEYYRRGLAEAHAAGTDSMDELLQTNLANALAWAGGFEEARSLLDHCEALRPLATLGPDRRLWRIQSTALLHWKQGEYTEALQCFAEAAKIGRQDPALRVGLIAALSRTVEAAQECGQHALGLQAAIELNRLVELRSAEQAAAQGAALLEIVHAAQISAEKEALQREGERLEQQVKARTAELSATLARLQAEVEMRRATEKALQAAHDELEQRVQERTAELQRAMTALVQREKLAALGSLVAGVAHELNTPIGNALLAATSFSHKVDDFRGHMAGPAMQKRTLHEFVDAAEDSCQLIEQSLERSANLVSSFKAIASTEADEILTDFELRVLLTNTLNLFAPSLEHRGIAWQLHCPDKLQCHTSAGALTRVVSCLLENVLTHAFPQPQAHAMLTVSATETQGQITLEISDNGHGIASELLSRVFEPFFTSRLGQGGSGLGLHVSHNLMTGLLAGDISAHSERGQGCRFRMRFPQRISP